jgi:hypothetical protein
MRLSKTNGIVFFKSHDGERCEIYDVWSFLNKNRPIVSLSPVRNQYNFVGDCYNSYQEFLSKNKKNDSYINKLVVFGKLDFFEVDGYKIPILDVAHMCPNINSNWFEKNGSVDERFAIFFVPYGKKLFTLNPAWSTEYKKWISFNDKFQFLSEGGIKVLNEQAKRIYPKLFRAIINSVTIKEIAESFDKIFESSLDEIKNKVKSGKAGTIGDYGLTSLKILVNKESLSYNEQD